MKKMAPSEMNMVVNKFKHAQRSRDDEGKGEIKKTLSTNECSAA